MTLRLLRGRVMLRPETPVQSAVIYMPGPGRDRGNSLGIGVVLDMGPPALTPLRWDTDAQEWKGGVEIPPQFKVGDRVRYVGQHVSRHSWWDAEDVSFCAQEEVQCVIDPH